MTGALDRAARRLPNPLPCSPEHGRRLASAGVDILGIAIDGWSSERARAIGWVAGLRTRARRVRGPDGELQPGGEGIDRGLRVAMCGRIVIAREVRGDGRTTWGLAQSWCRDRGCPHCMAILQRQRAAKLRAFAAPFIADSLFVTFTQPKLPLELEGPGEAADRVLGRNRDGLDTGFGYRELWRGSSRRIMVAFFCGGLRALEVVLSKAGTVRRDGSVIETTGWHAHLHNLLQLTAPSLERAVTASRWMTRRLRELEGDERPAAMDERERLIDLRASAWKIAARIVEGVDQRNEWKQLARGVVLARWLAVSPGSQPFGQDVQYADPDRVGQVMKYVTKPFELRDGRHARALFVALDKRHAIRAWGTWRSWAAGEDEDEDEDGARIEVSRTPIRALFAALDCEQRSFLDEQMTIDFRTYEVLADARRVMADIKAQGTTFRARDRRLAWGDTAGQVREHVRRTAGRLRLNAMGLFDLDLPAPTWRPPPYQLRDFFEQRAARVEESYALQLEIAAKLELERKAVRSELQAAGCDASDADVELEICRRQSAELAATRPARHPIDALRERVALLEDLLSRDRVFGDRYDLEDDHRRAAAELAEVNAILDATAVWRTRGVPRHSPDDVRDCWEVVRTFPDLHRLAAS